jgi:cysteinyl-tRNA synthetase
MMLCTGLLLEVSLLFAYVHGVVGFPVRQIVTYRNSVEDAAIKILFASSTNQDEYDDFYADFNPAEFDSYSQGQGIGDDSQRHSNTGHDYTRDGKADNSNVDVEAVNQLISDRLTMRKNGRFNEADRIRNELLDKYGVLVRDKDKKWRSGCSRSGSGLKWLQASPKSNASRRSRESESDLGPNGHDYVMAIDAGKIRSKFSVEEINKLLAERLARKFNRDFQGADEIQAELVRAGVFIDDKKREWRADGKSFREYEPNEYTLSSLSSNADDFSIVEIESLIKARAVLKAERLFKQSDGIRDDLLHRFNVFVDDKSLQWSVGNPFPGEEKWGNKYRRFQLAKSSEIPSELDRIEKLLELRDTARVNRDFEKADEIRSQLVDEYNVYVNDKKREWSVGWTADRPEKSVATEPKNYKQRGGGALSEEDLDKVQKLLIERRSLKRNRRYDEADAIGILLSDEFDVSIDDRNSEWHLRNGPYIATQDCKTLDEETQRTIKDMVERRLQARNSNDFGTADDIRHDLETKFSVHIDDRLREWYIQ